MGAEQSRQWVRKRHRENRSYSAVPQLTGAHVDERLLPERPWARIGEITFDPEKDILIGQNKKAIKEIIDGIERIEDRIHEVLQVFLHPKPPNKRNFLAGSSKSHLFVRKLLISLRKLDDDRTIETLFALLLVLEDAEGTDAHGVLFDELRAFFSRSAVLQATVYRMLKPMFGNPREDPNLFEFLVTRDVLRMVFGGGGGNARPWAWNTAHPLYFFMQNRASFSNENEWEFWQGGSYGLSVQLDVLEPRPTAKVLAQHKFAITTVTTNRNFSDVTTPRFTLGARLGGGAFSLVHALVDNSASQDVRESLWVCKASDLLNANRIKQEIRGMQLSLACVQNGYIIGTNMYTDVFVHMRDADTGRFVFVMENAGGDVVPFLHNSDQTAIAPVITQILMALAAFHKATLQIHGDLKLDNVLLNRSPHNQVAPRIRYILSKENEDNAIMHDSPSALSLYMDGKGLDVESRGTWSDVDREVVVVDIRVFDATASVSTGQYSKANVIDWGLVRTIQEFSDANVVSLTELMVAFDEGKKFAVAKIPQVRTDGKKKMVPDTNMQIAVNFSEALFSGLKARASTGPFQTYREFVAIFEKPFMLTWKKAFSIAFPARGRGKGAKRVHIPDEANDKDLKQLDALLNEYGELGVLRIYQGIFLFAMLLRLPPRAYFALHPVCFDHVSFVITAAWERQKFQGFQVKVAAPQYLILGECFHASTMRLFTTGVAAVFNQNNTISKGRRRALTVALTREMTSFGWNEEMDLLENIMRGTGVPFTRTTLGQVNEARNAQEDVDIYTVNMCTRASEAQRNVKESKEAMMQHSLRVSEDPVNHIASSLTVLQDDQDDHNDDNDNDEKEKAEERKQLAHRESLARSLCEFTENVLSDNPTPQPKKITDMYDAAADLAWNLYCEKRQERARKDGDKIPFS